MSSSNAGALKRSLLVIGFGGLLFSGANTAQAQSQSVHQSGAVTAGHLPVWIYNGVVGDAGTSNSPMINSLGVYGTGTPFCISNTKNYAGQYYKLCMGYATDLSAAQISLQGFGGAPNIPLDLIINGTTYAIGGSSTWLSNIFDQVFGSTPGDMLCRGTSMWVALAPGSVGQVLTANGTNGCPQWTAPGGTTTPLLRVISSGTTDTASTTDGTIAWNSSSASGKTENLYACNGGSNGKVLYVKDAIGTASTYQITLVPNGSDTIDGSASYFLAFNYQSATLQCLGATNNWMNL